MEFFPRAQAIRLPPNSGVILLVVIDTEEEFDWSKPLDRRSTSVSAMDHIERVQSIFDEFKVRPVYVVDYPVATQEQGYRPLRRFLESGRAEIGAHLQPWVSPPYVEAVNAYNSYPGNLPAELEARKLQALTEAITEHFGHRPTIYKAGRYGFGPHTAGLLEAMGYEIDLSPTPPYDMRADGGPNYALTPPTPFWFGPQHRLLCCPATGGYLGYLRGIGTRLGAASQGAKCRRLRLPGILWRAGALQRLRLSPEGQSIEQLLGLAAALRGDGVGVFSLTLHSPSVVPGCTPYVRDDAELAVFLDRIRRFLEHFLGPWQGRTMTPGELRTYLQRP